DDVEPVPLRRFDAMVPERDLNLARFHRMRARLNRTVPKPAVLVTANERVDLLIAEPIATDVPIRIRQNVSESDALNIHGSRSAVKSGLRDTRCRPRNQVVMPVGYGRDTGVMPTHAATRAFFGLFSRIPVSLDVPRASTPAKSTIYREIVCSPG